jgi:hypothetical protein
VGGALTRCASPYGVGVLKTLGGDGDFSRFVRYEVRYWSKIRFWPDV